jgi:hypothetical protein
VKRILGLVLSGAVPIPALPIHVTTQHAPSRCRTSPAAVDAAYCPVTVPVTCGTCQNCTHWAAGNGRPCCLVTKSGVYLRSETGEVGGIAERCRALT